MLKRRTKTRLGAVLALPLLALPGISCSRHSGDEPASRAAARPPRPSRPVPPIEILPQDRVYFFGVRGQSQEKELVLTSHLDHPLGLRDAVTDNSLFHSALTPLEAGHRYRLRVTLDPRAPAGKTEGTLRLTTDDPAHPAIEIPLRAALDERVSATPDRVYFGRLRAADLGTAGAERRVLLARHRGPGFRVLGASSDLPFLDLAVAPGRGESWLLKARLNRKRLPRGEIRGTVVVRTNDSEFREIRLPVTGTIL